MKILYCTSEANPYAGSGGLADVAASLPKTLRQRGVDCRVVMPLYGDIPQYLRTSKEKVCTDFMMMLSVLHSSQELFLKCSLI